MSLSLTGSIAKEEASTFAPAEHLLGIVQRVVASRENTRIVLPEKGEVVVLPERGQYYTNVQDMADFCRPHAASFESNSIGDAIPQYAHGFGRNIKDLLWQASFHSSQGRMLEGCSKYDVVQFRHWPNLTRLPVTPNTARICALLTRHPVTIMLVHRMLGIDKEEVCQIYSAGHSAGLAHVTSRISESTSLNASAADTRPERPQERGLFHSLFTKIAGL